MDSMDSTWVDRFGNALSVEVIGGIAVIAIVSLAAWVVRRWIVKRAADDVIEEVEVSFRTVRRIRRVRRSKRTTHA